ncbi:non-specific lipid transfer protein GPI-anchored 9-like [Corylus avellana]|uniref:non-specific lipid transfer protein GPI-anchored 9-like n=1 Tax=Corylus avellana TaxID=13451 RepID=UPI00286A8C48|nr:non-specific lipid transfer protein GPI-anchored 9-like [Corylus avellana]
MASKHILASFLLFSSWVFVGYSEIGFATALQGGSSGGGNSMACLQKLLPCQAYLKPPSSPPTACCLPLKEMVSDDPKCLCDVFDNPDILKSLNVTKDDAMKLAKACAVNADISVCNKEASPPTNSAAALAPSSSNSSSSNKSSNSAPKVAVCGFSHFGVSGFTALIVALFISAFQA